MLAFLSQAHIEPDLTIEMFLMDGPVPGFGALELVDPAGSEQPGRRAIAGRLRRRDRSPALRPVGARAPSPVVAVGDID